MPQDKPQRQAQKRDDEQQSQGGNQKDDREHGEDDAASRAGEHAEEPPRGPQRLGLPVREGLACFPGRAVIPRLRVLDVEVEEPPLDGVAQDVDGGVERRRGVRGARVVGVLVWVHEPAEGAVLPLDVIGRRLFFHFGEEAGEKRGKRGGGSLSFLSFVVSDFAFLPG